MTEKGHQKFWQMKIEKFTWEKVKLEKFPTVSEKMSETGAKSETGRMHHCLRGDGRPWSKLPFQIRHSESTVGHTRSETLL